jgi:hypothetical protein
VLASTSARAVRSWASDSVLAALSASARDHRLGPLLLWTVSCADEPRGCSRSRARGGPSPRKSLPVGRGRARPSGRLPPPWWPSVGLLTLLWVAGSYRRSLWRYHRSKLADRRGERRASRWDRHGRAGGRLGTIPTGRGQNSPRGTRRRVPGVTSALPSQKRWATIASWVPSSTPGGWGQAPKSEDTKPGGRGEERADGEAGAHRGGVPQRGLEAGRRAWKQPPRLGRRRA